RVYQIWHDSPGWTHAGNDRTRNPSDLRDVYRFARRTAEQYRGQVDAWEVWNEPDIGFWPDLSDTYAGVLKAAYLGFKSVDPELPVLIGSFCRGAGEFDRGVMEAGAADYFDIFNWHIYARPEAYAGALQRYLEILKPFGAADRPVWLTEAGIRLTATEPGGELKLSDERRQAEFIPRSFALSLAGGTDRHFFFVFPYYLENGVQFGCVHRDLSPRAACVAIAAAVDLLGEARYLGQLKLADAPDVTVLAFQNGQQRVLVVWADKVQDIKLDVAAPKVTVADLYGKRGDVATQAGQLPLTANPEAQYVLGVGEGIVAKLSGPVRAPGKLPENQPCPVIVRGQLQTDALDKDGDSYLVSAEACQYAVEAYNFTEKAVSGTLAVQGPEGWTVTPGEAPVTLEPMGRAVATFTVTPGQAAPGLLKLTVQPRFEGLKVAPSVSHVRFDFSRIPPMASEDLKLDGATAWIKNISGNGHMEITPGDEGVRFDIHFTAPGDRWCYPRVEFDPPRDFSPWQGLAFDYRCHAAAPKTTVRLQVIEAGGSNYLCGPMPSTAEWKTATLRFADLAWGSFSPPDADGKLDLDAIKGLMIGGNTPENDIWLEIRHVRLVRW
ncbi:MAG: hypothetical protein KKI08_27575, partial [Armatimonadetes bacterium]|nr:hypothetical protein [Armatimonadota bacterium]